MGIFNPQKGNCLIIFFKIRVYVKGPKSQTFELFVCSHVSCLPNIIPFLPSELALIDHMVTDLTQSRCVLVRGFNPPSLAVVGMVGVRCLASIV
jgi:hypothetical protein